MFVRSVVLEDRSVINLLDANYTYVNERLATHYGIPGVLGNDFRKVPLPPGSHRGGVMTQASVLKVTADGTRTSPVLRGKWVLERVVGKPPAPPPPDVPLFKEAEGAARAMTMRERMAEHRTNPVCAGCHAKMDTIGFALENYNAIGAWRTKDGAFDIDPAGTLPDGTAFKGAGDLKTASVAKKDQFARCVIEKMLIYAVGRGLEPYDDRSIDKALAAVAKDKYRFSSVVVEIVKSDPFRLRRGRNVQD